MKANSAMKENPKVGLQKISPRETNVHFKDRVLERGWESSGLHGNSKKGKK